MIWLLIFIALETFVIGAFLETKLKEIMTAQDDLKAALDQDEVLLDAVLAFIIKLQGQAGETITPELIAEAKDIGAKLQTVNTGSTPPTV